MGNPADLLTTPYRSRSGGLRDQFIAESSIPTSVEINTPAAPKIRPAQPDSTTILRDLRSCEQLNALGEDFFTPPVLSPGERRRVEASTVRSSASTAVAPQVIKQDGIEHGTLGQPRSILNPGHKPSRRFNSSERHSLDTRRYLDFYSSVTGYVLAKNDKLSPIEIKKEGTKLLFEMKDFDIQLRKLRQHFFTHDVANVFHIVIPLNIHESSALTSESYNLFSDFAILTPQVVACSNYWYHEWYDDDELSSENLGFIYQCLEKNTDPDLWKSCMDEYDRCGVSNQGGTLMFLLLMKKIFMMSEATLVSLQNSIKVLKISDVIGENVEEVISVIKSTERVFYYASRNGVDWMPRDFAETVLKIMQTSSCDEFNNIFWREETTARALADKNDAIAKFPPVKEICTLAKNSYLRFTSPNSKYQWVLPDAQGTAYNYRTPSVPQQGSPSTSNSASSTNPCFNCGTPGCIPSKCPKPLDEARIKRMRDAYMKAKEERLAAQGKSPSHFRSKKSSSGHNKKIPRDAKGRPQKYNKNGALVVDQKKLLVANAQREAAKAKSASAKHVDDELKAHLTKLENALDAKSSPPPTASPDTLMASVADIRKCLNLS